MRGLPIASWPPKVPAASDGPPTPAVSSRTPTPAARRSRGTDELAWHARDLEEENALLRAELERARGGGARPRKASGASSRKSSARSEDGRSLSRVTSRTLRRSTALKDTAVARLHEAVLENEEVLQRNRELNDQVRELRRARLSEREQRAEQDAAVQDLVRRVRTLEDEKMELQNSLQGKDKKLPEVNEWSQLPRPQRSRGEPPPEETPRRAAEQPEKAPTPPPVGWDPEGAAAEAGSQEVRILGLQEDFARVQQENQQLLDMCREFEVMLAAERQAAEQAKREAERLQSKLALERLRRRAQAQGHQVATQPSTRSSSRTEESDPMHMFARGSLAQELADSDRASNVDGGCEPELVGLRDRADSAFSSGASNPDGAATVAQAVEERTPAEKGAFEWLQDEAAQKQPESAGPGPSELAAAPEEPWWWSRLFGSTLCCTRPPPEHPKRAALPPSAAALRLAR